MQKVFISLLLFCLSYKVDAHPKGQGYLSLPSFAACVEAKGSPPSILYTPDTSAVEYQKFNYQWNTRLGNIQPLAFLTVNNEKDISNGIICAKETGIRIVAKSGGHSYEKYSFGDNRTIVMDLRNLNDISLSEEGYVPTATVGSGVLLSHLYSAIWFNGRFGLAGGSCIGPGAGHTLGAGYGYLSKRFGVTLDNVLEMEMVDADGDIRIANANTNSDLFWALRGAGAGNFGIVTKIKYRLFDASALNFTQVYIRYYDAQRFNEVFAAWDSWNAANQDGTAYAGLSIGLRYLTVSIIDVGLSDIDVHNIKNHFPPEAATVKSMNFMELVVEGSYPRTQASELANVQRETHPRYNFRAKSYFGSKVLTSSEIEEVAAVLTRIPGGCTVRFSSYGGAINRIPSDATAFVHRNSLYNIQLEITQENSAEVDNWVKEFDRTAIALLDNGESYQSYNDGELEDYLVRYYGSNLPRLVEIKNRYDPDNIFSFAQSIPLRI